MGRAAMRRAAALIAATLLAASVAAAGELDDAVRETRAAFEAGDSQKLRELASSRRVDPWLVADELCSRGEWEAGQALARAGSGAELEPLAAYLASRGRRGGVRDPAAGEALWRLQQAGDPEEQGRALDAAAEIGSGADELLATRLDQARGVALGELARFEESKAAFGRAAEAAARLGWIAMRADALEGLAYIAGRQSDPARVLAIGGEVLALRESLGDPVGIARASCGLGDAHDELEHYTEAREAWERCLALTQTGQEELLWKLFVASVLLGDAEPERAYFARLLEAAVQPDVRSRLAENLKALGDRRGEQGDPVAAQRLYERALEIRESLGEWEVADEIVGEIAANYLLEGDLDGLAAFEERSRRRRAEGGDGAREAELLVLFAAVHDEAGEPERVLKLGRQAFEIQKERGDRQSMGEALGWVASAQSDLGDHRGSIATWREVLALEQETGQRDAAALTLGVLGYQHEELEEYAEALAWYRRSLEAKEALDDAHGAAKTRSYIGIVQRKMGNVPEAVRWLEEAAAGLEQAEDPRYAAVLLSDIGSLLAEERRWEEAVAYLERACALVVKAEDEWGMAAILGKIGSTYLESQDYRRVIETHERTLELMEKRGDLKMVSATLTQIGDAHHRLGEYRKAIEIHQRALALSQEVGDTEGVAASLGNTGVSLAALGDYDRALDMHRRELELKRSAGLAGMGATLSNMAVIHLARGDYARALASLEQALAITEKEEDRLGMAAVLGNLGSAHQALGDEARALAYLERSAAIHEELENRAGLAAALAGVGLLRAARGDQRGAEAAMKRSLDLAEELEAPADVARAHSGLASVLAQAGELKRALEAEERARKIHQESGNRPGALRSTARQGLLLLQLGRGEEALASFEACREEAVRLGSARDMVLCDEGIAEVHLERGEHRDALRSAREAAEVLPRLVRGQAEEQGAMAREQFARIFEVGALAAAALGDADELAFALESGRAASLLEALQGREALSALVLPEPLRNEDRESQGAEQLALARYRRAQSDGNDERIEARRRELDAVRARRRGVIERIQREAKAAADVVYPEPASLAEIQAQLRERDALLVYGVFSKSALALVVTRAGSRVVALGESRAIAEASTALLEALAADGQRGAGPAGKPLTRGAADPTAGIATLRERVIDPLGLDENVRRLLVSPHGPLWTVPFTLLAPGREVVYVPSGSAYVHLASRPTARGTGVLALGDPDYGASMDPHALVAFTRGQGLAPLPGTRAEAETVGDEVLLGKQASESGLREALAKRPRWEAVHLACHGLVNPEQPTLSSLALTPSGDDDGFLTTLEVFGMRVPADIAVLSACETAGGRLFAAEGMMGLSRAFMLAGAPRLLVSLWKVDDEATRALMVKFYELWRPQGERAGLPIARALEQAQATVRSQEGWRHPFYWAAWQLWGLP